MYNASMDTKAMQSAASPLPNNAPPVRLNETIRVNSGRKAFLGSCNGCTEPVYELGGFGDELVAEVQLRGLNFRLCCNCRATLKGLL